MLLPTKCHKLCVCLCVPFRLCPSLYFSLTVTVSISFAHCLWHVWYIFRLWELWLQHHKMSAWCVGLAAKCCQMSILHGSLHLPLSLSLSLCCSPLSHSLAHFICCSLNAVKIDQTWVCKRFSSRKTIWYICFFINSAWIETATWQSNFAQPKTVAQLKWIPFSWNFKWAFMLREIPITAQPKAQPGQQQQH